jgi:putative transposase
MANTYTQIYIQIVFAVKGRRSLIGEKNREELQKYITGVVQNREQKILAIYCNPDHTHIFIGMKPTIAISDLTREIKALSSKFINERNWVRGKFQWQEGFGAFSYAYSQLANVINYINSQPERHKKVTFKEEYLDLLKEFKISFDDKYLFEWIEDGQIHQEKF